MSNLNLTNASVLDQIRLAGTNDYQQRIPASTQATIQQIHKALMDPLNNNQYNEAISNLVRLIGTQIIRSKVYPNHLAKFKRVNVYRRQSLQEIGFNLIKAKGYDMNKSDLFEINSPEIKVAYHTENRKDKYPITINHGMLEDAFLVENGLANFIEGALASVMTSDNNDEFRVMMNLFASYAENFGFYNVEVPDINADNASEADIKLLLEKIRALTGRWKFLSGAYNHYGVPTFTRPENTLLITTPEIIAKIDVNVLSAAFNVSMAEAQNKIIEVDEIPIDNCIAVLLDEDWFMCGDTLYETTSFFDPSTLNTQYYLFHYGIYGTSPFMNCAIFTTSPSTNIPTITFEPTEFGFDIYDMQGEEASAIVNNKTVLRASLSGSVTPDNPNVSKVFTPAVFTITDLIEPIAESVAASTTSETITKVEVNAETFGLAVDNETGTYEFDATDAGAWTLDEDIVSLEMYGLEVTGEATADDKIIVEYVAEQDKNIPLTSRTYVDRIGVIHIQFNARKKNNKVIIKAESTYDKNGISGASNYTDVKTFTMG